MPRSRRRRETSSSPVCRARRRPSRPSTTPTWPSIPDGPAKDGGKAVGVAAAAGMLAMRTGDDFDDNVPYVQPPPGPGVFEPIAPTPPVDLKLPLVRPFTYTRSPTTGPGAARADEQALRAGRGGAAGVRSQHQRRADAGADRDRSLPHRADVLPVQPHAAGAGRRPWPRPARVGAAARLRERRDGGHDGRLLGGEVPLHPSGVRTTRSSGPTRTGTRSPRPTGPGCR